MPEIVQITVNTKMMDLFRFMVFHSYTKFTGMLTFVASVVSLILLPFSYFMWKDMGITIALLLMVVIYLIITPLNMLSQSRRQVISNPIFKNPITYHISEEVFEVQQYTGTIQLYWGQILKVKKSPYDYLFYVNTEQAFIIPKKLISPEELPLLEEIIVKVKDELGKQVALPSELGSRMSRKSGVKESIGNEDKDQLEAVDEQGATKPDKDNTGKHRIKNMRK